MQTVHLIEAKRDGSELPEEAIRTLIRDYTLGRVPDYQMSALLMAVVWRGLSDRETFSLTDAMTASGETLDLSSFTAPKLDKHSTGGVGDKTSLAVVPILAAGGVIVAKMSGRGLGHTGGTLDKLESIPGFRVALTTQEIIAQIETVGACLCAQTDTIAPADKKLYALRDVTGTVESLPLIAASIMSKKLASGADAILLDVKVGRGAFMKSLGDARSLAQTMRRIGAARGKRVAAELTDMDIPLGRAVGNRLEVNEIVDLLKNRPCDARLRELVVDLAGAGLSLCGRGDRAEAERLLQSGAAWEKFQQIVAAQGGEVAALERRESAPYRAALAADQAGWVTDLDALKTGQVAMTLGAGRLTKDDSVDPLAGIWLERTVGDRVETGETLAVLYAERPTVDLKAATEQLRAAYVIGDVAPVPRALVFERLDADAKSSNDRDPT